MHGKIRHFDSPTIGIIRDARMNHNASVRLSNYKSNVSNLKQFDKKEGILAYTFDHIYACNDNNVKNASENLHMNVDQSEVNNTSNPTAAFSQLTDNFNNTINEVRHLKDLLLLHLDLIQQQSEQLLTKEKVIASLKKENDSLKLKLSRTDRRVYTKHNNTNGLDSGSESPEQMQIQFSTIESFFENGYCSDARINVNAEDNTTGDYNNVQVKDVALRIVNNQLENDKNKAKFSKLKFMKERVLNKSEECNNSSIIGENGGNLINKIILHKIHADYELSLNSFNHINNVDDLNVGSEEIISHKEVMSPSVEVKIENKDYLLHNNEMQIDSINLRGGIRKRNIENSSGVHDCRNNLEVKKRIREILMTTKEYHIGIGDVDFGSEEQEPSLNDQSSILEVPRWCGQSYTSSCSVEGIENLDDAVISKRHMKMEIEEKRRKRWDVQRIREQRNVERLKSRQNRSGSRTCEFGSGAMGGGAMTPGRVSPGASGVLGGVASSKTRPGEDLGVPVPCSLWPHPQDARYIVLTEQLPVCALGANLPVLQPSEFSLPWRSRTTPSSPRTISRRMSHSNRRRRRQRRQRVTR